MGKIEEFINPHDMQPIWLMMEYERLLLMDFKGEKDEEAPYDLELLRRQIQSRLNEYQLDF